MDESLVASNRVRAEGARRAQAEHAAAAKLAAVSPKQVKTLDELGEERAHAVRLASMLEAAVTTAEGRSVETGRALDAAKGREAEATAAHESAKASYLGDPASAVRGEAVTRASDAVDLVRLRVQAATSARDSATGELDVARASLTRARADVVRLDSAIAVDTGAFHVEVDPLARALLAHIRGALENARALCRAHDAVEAAERRHREGGHGPLAGPDHGHMLLGMLDELAGEGIAVTEHDLQHLRYACSALTSGGSRGLVSDLASTVGLVSRMLGQKPAGEAGLARFREVLAVMREVPRGIDVDAALLARAQERRKAEAPTSAPPMIEGVRAGHYTGMGRTIGPNVGENAVPVSAPSIVGKVTNGVRGRIAAAARSALGIAPEATASEGLPTRVPRKAAKWPPA
jgi:hypothetical protein